MVSTSRLGECGPAGELSEGTVALTGDRGLDEGSARPMGDRNQRAGRAETPAKPCTESGPIRF